MLADGITTEVPVEEQWTERTWVQPDREPYEAERREQKLLLRLKAHLEARGHRTCRLKIVPPGEAKPLFSDLLDRTTHCLIEAKGTVERGALRMAIGQLADYSRFVDGKPVRAVLVPERPRADLLAMLVSQDIAVIWPAGPSGFEDTVGGNLV